MILLVVGLAGCLSRPPLVKEYYALEAPSRSGPDAPAGSGTLAVQPVTVSPLFDGKALVYRTGEHAYEQDPYAEFLETPGRMATVAVCDYLRHSGVFRQVLEPGDSRHADSRLEVYLDRIYGDFRKPDEGLAVLAIRFRLRPAAGDGSRHEVLQKDYARAIRLEEATAAALVAGWNRALEEIMTDLVEHALRPSGTQLK